MFQLPIGGNLDPDSVLDSVLDSEADNIEHKDVVFLKNCLSASTLGIKLFNNILSVFVVFIQPYYDLLSNIY